MMKALAEKHVPIDFVKSKYFQAYVASTMGHTYKAPSGYDLVKVLEDTCNIIHTKIRKMFKSAAFVAICVDS